jgi:hypothetical protein
MSDLTIFSIAAVLFTSTHVITFQNEAHGLPIVQTTTTTTTTTTTQQGDLLHHFKLTFLQLMSNLTMK